MKLIIQIPCLNEEDHLAATFSELPRRISGVDEIEVLIIDDGSTDKTSVVAHDIGAHHILRLNKNCGLSVAHMRGLDACYRLGADIVVNTDADNQYCADDISKLIQTLFDREADIVIGDRQVKNIAHFSPLKKILQQVGSGLVRRISGVHVVDSTSGFRAINRKAMSRLYIHNKFTYTLESIIHAGNLGLVIENVAISTNSKMRESRLFKSISEYLRKNGLVIFRSYAMYSPMKVFGYISIIFFVMGSILGARFLLYFFLTPHISSHIQSLQVGVGMIVISFIVALMALIADLNSVNRQLIEEVLVKLRNIENINEKVNLNVNIDELSANLKESWR